MFFFLNEIFYYNFFGRNFSVRNFLYDFFFYNPNSYFKTEISTKGNLLVQLVWKGLIFLLVKVRNLPILHPWTIHAPDRPQLAFFEFVGIGYHGKYFRTYYLHIILCILLCILAKNTFMITLFIEIIYVYAGLSSLPQTEKKYSIFFFFWLNLSFYKEKDVSAEYLEFLSNNVTQLKKNNYSFHFFGLNS